MGHTEKQFGGFLRMLTARMKGAIEALKRGDQEAALELMENILMDLQ